MIKCPNCQKKLIKFERQYVCENKHSFDIAKQGYTNLLIHTQKSTGDNKEMVDARQQFFANDYYKTLKNFLISLIKESNIKCMVDAGCGEGYYTNAIYDALNIDVYGFDMSKIALQKASRSHKAVNYFVSSVFDMPLYDSSVDLVLSVFAPISYLENRRILKDGGLFIKVSPLERHLWQLKEVLYQEPYENEMKYDEAEGFELIKEYKVKDTITINSSEDIMALFMMTPYYYRSPKDGVERLKSLDSLKTDIEFKIEVYKKS